MESTDDKKIELLYVEDDPVARRIATMLINHRFPEIVIHAAENGKDALEIYVQHRPRFVITDLNVPLMDGISLAREIRKLRYDTFIIAVSAHTDQRFVSEGISAGIDHYLSKPLEQKKLFALLEERLAEDS